jgi:hypothetical protein
VFSFVRQGLYLKLRTRLHGSRKALKKKPFAEFPSLPFGCGAKSAQSLFSVPFRVFLCDWLFCRDRQRAISNTGQTNGRAFFAPSKNPALANPRTAVLRFHSLFSELAVSLMEVCERQKPAKSPEWHPQRYSREVGTSLPTGKNRSTCKRSVHYNYEISITCPRSGTHRASLSASPAAPYKKSPLGKLYHNNQ